MPANRTEVGLSGHTIAGVIDAEAHFFIFELNGGRSLSAGMRVRMRDDDVNLLHALESVTGIGVVRSSDQRGNPQATWDVYRKDHAAALVRLLDHYPLRSRKRREFDVWRAAVVAWQGHDDERFDRMRGLKAALHATRDYREPVAASGGPRLSREGLDDWLAGFVAGDGSYSISGGSVRLTVRLRADDAPLLQALVAATGLGKVYGPYPNPGSRPVVSWTVCSHSDLAAVARRLDGRVPGRKAAEFSVWRRAIEAKTHPASSSQQRREVVDRSAQELKQLRRYRPPETPLQSAFTRRGKQMFEQNRRWLALLRSWAETEPGPLTGTAYQRARRDGWPNRNTLARRFGSWYDALVAARLSERAAQLPEARDRRLAGGAQARAERRALQRERVIAAMRRCAAELGHTPGPTEYARWRLHNDPRAPSFGTAYGLFPSGWSELQAVTQRSG